METDKTVPSVPSDTTAMAQSVYSALAKAHLLKPWITVLQEAQ